MATLSKAASKAMSNSHGSRPATSGNKNVVTSARRVASPDTGIERLMKPLKGPGVDGC